MSHWATFIDRSKYINKIYERKVQSACAILPAEQYRIKM